ncbi:MAG TPA: SURF1 family protein [Ilumatobacter sp.]|nr:SURF1 family protein [Ilumatobacter sp.]
MYRFLLTPKWIGFHLLVVAGIVTMINLGFWQLRRLDQRRDFNATVEARYDTTPVPLDTILEPTSSDPDEPALDDLEWRPVTVTGSYLAGTSIQIANRSQNGRAGENTVEGFALDDGRTLLVNRGFTPLTDVAPGAPAGTVTVTGRLRHTQQRRGAQLADPSEGTLTVAQRVDLERLAAQFDDPLVPMYLDLIESDPADGDPYPEAVVRPDLGEGNHQSYAVQWFLFAGAEAVGWVLAVRYSIGTRRAARARALDPAVSTE